MPATPALDALAPIVRPAPARLAWSAASAAVSALYRALDANATQGAWCCESAARGFANAAGLAAEPQRRQLQVLAAAAEALADPFGPDDAAVRALIDAAAETVAALEHAVLLAEGAVR